MYLDLSKMHHPHHAILLVGSLALASGPPCGPGEAAWPEDGQCHRLNTRGPCPADQVFLSSARGPRCSSFFDPDEETENSSSNVIHQEKQSKIRTEKTKLDSWSLPMRGQTPSKEESLCLAQEKVSVYFCTHLLRVIKPKVLSLSRFTGLQTANATAS